MQKKTWMPIQKAGKPARSPEYLAFVRGRRCCVPGCEKPGEPHHFGKRGMSQKCDDYRTVPLCPLHHRQFHDGNLVYPYDDGEGRAAWILFFNGVALDLVIEWLKQNQ